MLKTLQLNRKIEKWKKLSWVGLTPEKDRNMKVPIWCQFHQRSKGNGWKTRIDKPDKKPKQKSGNTGTLSDN